MPGAWVDWRSLRWLPIGVVVFLVGVLALWREPISQRLVPDPRLNRQLESAQAALVRGELTRSDGLGARELFESVLAIDPDQLTAREGLQRVRAAALARAAQALDAHRLLQARQHLDLAESLSAPAVQLQPLQARLHDLQKDAADIPRLLTVASRPGLPAEQALALYEQVLALDADNAIAIAGRHALLADWLAQAENLAREDRLELAQRLVDAVIDRDPAHLDLPSVQALLGEARARQQGDQARLLAAATAAENRGRLDQAAANYRDLLARNSQLEAARQGLLRCANKMAMRAIRQAADFDFKRAEASLAKARQWSPQAPAIEIASRRIAQSRLAQQQLTRSRSPTEKAQLPMLIEQANAALERDEFIAPPGVSAWDKLRLASAIAPQAATVRQLEERFRMRTRNCFEQALATNKLGQAQSCLEAYFAMDPVSAWFNTSANRLAERWRARAEERIAASDYSAAAAALDAAARWQPESAQLQALRARLRQAQGRQ